MLLAVEWALAYVHLDMRTDGFFEGFREWSDRKLALLQNYLGKPFTEILGRPPTGAFCVDGFAGRGEYGDGHVGSSLLSAQIAQGFENAGKYRLRCINVERNLGHFNNLVSATQRMTPGLVTNIHGEFATALSQIDDLVKSAPTIFFLDPYGLRGIEWRTLDPILQRPHRTEILIRLHTPYLHRLAGFLTSTGRAAEANIQRLTNTIGTDAWTGFDRSPDDQDEFISRIVSLYRGRLKTAFKYVGAYPVREVASERLKYHMIFCSRHHRGAIIMSDIVYKADEAFLDQRRENALRRGIQLGMLEPTVLPKVEAEILYEEKLQRLEQRMLAIILANPSGISYLDLKANLVEEFFGLVSDHYYRQAIRRLRSSSSIKGDPKGRVSDGEVLER